MNKEQLTRKLQSLESCPLDTTQTLLSEIIQLIQSSSEDLGLVNWGLLRISQTLTRSKQVEPFEKLKYYQILFKYVVESALKFELEIGSDSLRLIFDSSSEFYRKNLLDNNVEFPLSRDRPLKHHFPIAGEDCDAVRPGLTTTSRMAWTRCRVLNISNSGVYAIRFWNSNETYNISDGFWFAPLGERTLDFDWRVGIKVGDLVDALDGKNVWYLSTIVEVKEENWCKSVRVTFRYFDQNGDKVDSEGQRFVGWGSNEDEWIDLSSPRIQRPRTMLKKLCYYASTPHNQFVMDDNYDIVYAKEFSEKPFFSMLRSSMTRSQMIYSLWNIFIEQNGMGKAINQVKTGKNIDSIFNMGISLSLSCFMVPKMATQRLYSQYLKQLVEFVKNNARQLNNQRLDMLLWTLEALGKRYLTLCQKHDLIEDLKRFLIPRFLTMNLEKQLLALKCSYDLIKPLRSHSQQSEQELVDYIRENNLFYLIYQPNESHEQVLFRSTQLLQYMLKKKILGLKELDHLWNLFPLNDAKARVTLQKLIGDVVQEMENVQVSYILQKLLDVQAHEFTMDHLQLISVMKTKNKLEGESYTRALQLLWQLLTIKSATVKAAVESEVEKIFKTFITNIHDQRVRFELLNSMVRCLKQTTNLQKEPSFLKDFILSYPTQGEKKQNSQIEYPTSRSGVVSYLCQNDIYNDCLRHLSETKTEHKIQQILNLLSSLLQHDLSNNLSLIGQQVFQILGPSQLLLKWLSSLSLFLHNFISQLFIQTTVFQSFSNLSLASLNSISSMFNDINVIHNKRRFVKQKLQICDINEIEWNSYVFTMCKPDELIGMSFIENLLQVPQNSVVYAKLVELIVKLNVHLDESLFGEIQRIRREFVSKIIEEFLNINQKGELSQKEKHRLQSRISILNEFVDETEVNGLKGVQPYFRILKGESMNLKIQNNVPGSKKPKQLEIFVSDNITLDNLKDEIAGKLEEKKDDISLFKGKRTYQDKFNGRSLADLKITKGDVIRVDKSKIPHALRASLLNESKTDLSPKMKEVLKRIYSIYADLEKATVLSKANFFKICSEILKAEGKEDEAKKVAQNDNLTNKEIKFTQEQLNKQFLDRIKIKEDAIWKFVEHLGIQQDLRIQHKEITRELPVTAMPRYILAEDNIYKTLLLMLSNPHLAHQHTAIYKLFCSLPIYKQFKSQVFNEWTIENFNKSRSVYEINYILGSAESELSKQSDIDSSQPEFSIKFIKSGIHVLLKYLEEYHFEDLTKSIYSLNQMEKVVIAIILRILSGYVRINNQPNSFISQIYYQHVNELELDVFIQKITKKAEINEHDTKYKERFDKNNVVIPIEEINKVILSILQNLIETYTQSYIKEITPQVSRLCSILNDTSAQIIKTLLKGLTLDSINLRRTSANLLYLRASENRELLSYLLNQMLENIPSQNKSTTIQYFDLLTKLIEMSVKENVNSVDLLKLSQELLNRVLQYKSEERRSSIIPDRIILGLLSVVNCIFSSKPEIATQMTSYKWKLLNRCLFYPDPKDKISQIQIAPDVINTAFQPQFFEDYINAKTTPTRAMLINVIIHLAKHQQENQPDFLEAVLEPLLQQIPEKPKKPNTKGIMVGVQNLGAICYMSSMCQSLNTISGFRNGLSMVNKEESKLITATQRMLAYLLFSQRQDYTPSAFLQSFHQPINPNTQQDTTQFLNLYFDQLENELQNTPYSSLLRQLFQGSTVIQMICNNCKNKRERKEQYFCYSVGVREKPTLELALQGMHDGDIINDYMCEACGVKSDLIKRSVLGDLPNFFFLHLQRIVNLDFYRYTKIHSKCLFPLQLNIEPFTKEGVELREQVGVEYLKKLPQNQQENKKFQELCKHDKPEKSYVYNLKSIIVHSGSAEGGHYYTITKREGGWAKMDDSKSTIFTLEQFEAECYGGPFNVIGEWGIEESKNAYVLLYEKEIKSLINLDFSDHPSEVSKLEIDLQTSAKGIEYQKFKTFNTEPLYKQVWLDNHRLMLEGHIFGEGCAKDFIKLIQSISQTATTTKKAELIAEVLFKISVWSNQVGGLMTEFQKCSPGFELFLKYVKDYEATFNILFHNDKNIRAATSKFLSILIINSIKNSDDTPEIYKFLDYLISKLNLDVAKNWLRLQSYFDLLYTIIQFSQSSSTLYTYFISKNLIASLIDFILEKDSPLKISIKKHSMGNKFNNVQLTDCVKIIYWLVQRSYGLNGKNDDEGIPIWMKFHLSDNDVFALSSMLFYGKMIKQGQAVIEIAAMIERFSVENLNFVEAISRNLLRILNDSMERLSECLNIITCIERVLMVKDSLWSKKAEFILGVGQPYQINKDNTFPSLDIDRFSYNSILEDIFPIECVLNLSFISRQRYIEISIYLVRMMLRVALSSPQATEFFHLQPPPNYMFLKYTNWWDSFVTFAFETISTKSIKQEELNSLKSETNNLLATWRSKLQILLDSSDIITGKIIKTTKITSSKFDSIQMSLSVQQSEVYTIPSLPQFDHQANLSLTKYLTHQRLQDSGDNIAEQSDILKFMTTSKPALAITDDKAETSSNKAQYGHRPVHGPKTKNQVYYDSDSRNFNVWDEIDQAQRQKDLNNSSSQQNSKPMEVEQPVKPTHIDPLKQEQSKQSQMIVEPVVINLDVPISVVQFFQTITITNHSDQSVWTRICIPNVNYLEANCLIPHMISGSVMSHKSETYLLYKLDPSRQFGNFNYEIFVEEQAKRKKKIVAPGFFKVYGEQKEQPIVMMEVEEPKEINQERKIDGLGDGDRKLCPVCTFENEAFAEKCDMCESLFM